MQVLNEKLGIKFWGHKGEDGLYKNIHFCDSNGVEIDAFLEDIIVDFYDEMINEFYDLMHMTEYEQIEEFLRTVSCREIVDKETDETVYLNFNGKEYFII